MNELIGIAACAFWVLGGLSLTIGVFSLGVFFGSIMQERVDREKDLRRRVKQLEKNSSPSR